MNRHQTYAFLAISEAVLNLGISIYLAHKIGLFGVAWGTLIPCLPIEGIALPLYTARVLGLPAGKMYRKVFIEPVLASLPCALFFWAMTRWSMVHNWGEFGAAVALGVLIFAGCAVILLMLGEDQELVTTRLRSFQVWLRPRSVA
jgi:O-antigen/teichoic acid export membrane protein